MENETNDIVERSVVEAIERAAIDVQIATAKKYPMHDSKNLSRVKTEMLAFATVDEETAASCFFTLPRGGKAIQGPSIRMAEIAVSCYGNLHVTVRVAETVTEGDNPHVVVQAVAHDLERNVRVGLEKRRRITKKKSKKVIDEDDINLACNACIAISYRDAAFKVIPMALVKPVYEAAKRVAVGNLKSLAAKRSLVFEKLLKMGATEDRILAVVGCRKVDDLNGDDVGVLIGLGTALKDGDVTLEHAFPSMDFYQAKAKADATATAKTGSKTIDAKFEDTPPTEQSEAKGKPPFMEDVDDPETKARAEEEKAKLAAAEAGTGGDCQHCGVAEFTEHKPTCPLAADKSEKPWTCKACFEKDDSKVPFTFAKPGRFGKKGKEHDGCPKCYSPNIAKSDALEEATD